MKKLTTLLTIVSLSVFSIGCGQNTDTDTGTDGGGTDAADTGGTGDDMGGSGEEGGSGTE